jgi:hypothetical protein
VIEFRLALGATQFERVAAAQESTQIGDAVAAPVALAI